MFTGSEKDILVTYLLQCTHQPQQTDTSHTASSLEVAFFHPNRILLQK